MRDIDSIQARTAHARRQRDLDRGAGGTDLVSILWRRKGIVLGSMLFFVLAGLAYIAVTPPRYLASTSILIDPRLGKSVGSDPVMPGFVPDASAIDSQIKLFTSQTVLARVAKMAHLADDPEFDGSARSMLQRFLHPGISSVDGVDIKALEEAITIKRPERTYVVGIDVLTRDPAKSATIANDVAQAYIEDQISSRIDAARTDTVFVSQRLDHLSDALRDAENKVEAYKIEHDIVDTAGLRSNEQQVSDLTRSLGDARSKTSDAKAKLTEIDDAARRGRLDASSQALQSLTMERLRQQEAETEQNVAKLATTLGAHHPELQEARGRQREIERLIHDELQRLRMAAASDYKQALDHERQVDAEVKRLKSASADMNQDLVPLEKLERNVRTLRSSFERFSQVNDNLAQQEADSPPGRVIAIARPPVSPASPKKTIIGTISLAAGLFFGLAAALFVESLGPDRAPAPSLVYEAPLAAEPATPQPRTKRRYWDDDDV